MSAEELKQALANHEKEKYKSLPDYFTESTDSYTAYVRKLGVTHYNDRLCLLVEKLEVYADKVFYDKHTFWCDNGFKYEPVSKQVFHNRVDTFKELMSKLKKQ